MIVPIRAKKNTAMTLVTPAFDAEWSNQYVSSAAGLDTELSKDKGAFADATNELTEIGSSGVYTLDLEAAELNYTVVAVKPTSSTTGVNFPLFLIHTYTEPVDDANTELAAVPSTTGSLRAMIQFLHAYFRNKRTETASEEIVTKEDASTTLGTRALSDDGTTFTRGEMA